MTIPLYLAASPVVVPPTPTSVLLGLYDDNNTVSAINSDASALGVSSKLKGYSFYTDGTSWGSIGSWTVPGSIPAGGVLMLAVDLTQNSTGCSVVPGSSAAQTAFKNLAGNIPNGTIIRLGWEFDIPTGPWGKGASVSTGSNSPATYIAAFQAVVGWMRSINNTFKYDWCCNTGTSTLAQLETYYPGDSFVDYIGGDHYDNPGGGGDFSQFGACINMAHDQNKPLSCGEWGLATSRHTDNPTFINDGAQVFLNPASASARYGWPSYTVGYHSYFNSAGFGTKLNSGSYPNSLAAYAADFG